MIAAVGLALVLVACKREAPPPSSAPTPSATAPETPLPAPVAESESGGENAQPIDLKDVSESTPAYVIGISYQTPSVAAYPGLAAEMRRYADAARQALIQAAAGRKSTPGAPLYDLSLNFTEVSHSPALVAVAAEGSSYTGGAHGAPLLARFVWLPQSKELLKADALIVDKRGWEAVSGYVREQLHSALSQRVDADALPPGERAGIVESAGRMIEQGTKPDPANFALFEPLPGAGGKLGGLRFVFAPYEVGPYSDGTQTVDVPASVLLPHVAPAYRGLFEGG